MPMFHLLIGNFKMAAWRSSYIQFAFECKSCVLTNTPCIL
jgi:hypothetical protein